MEVALPGHLPSQTTKAGLAAGLNQQPQPLLNHSALRLCAAAPHRLPHQLVIDVDVRTHIVLCKDRTILCIGSMAHGEAIWPSSRRPSRCKYSWRFVRSNLLLSSKLVAERMPS